jgi:hypothetical protein
VWATAVAVALVNVGVATLAVEATGSRGLAPGWLGVVLVVLGVGAALWAVLLWRDYLGGVRQR